MTAPMWRRNDEVAYVKSMNRVALMHLGHPEREPLILQGSAAVIWQLLESAMEEQQLVDSVARHFSMEREKVEGAVREFIEQLSALDLAVEDSAASG